MTWGAVALFGLAGLLAWTVLLPFGGPLLWVGAIIAYVAADIPGDSATAEDNESWFTSDDADVFYWRTLLVGVIGLVGVIAFVWVLANGKVWRELGKALSFGWLG